MNLLFFTSRMWEFDDLTGDDRKLLGHARLRVLETHDFFWFDKKFASDRFWKKLSSKSYPFAILFNLHLLPSKIGIFCFYCSLETIFQRVVIAKRLKVASFFIWQIFLPLHGQIDVFWASQRPNLRARKLNWLSKPMRPEPHFKRGRNSNSELKSTIISVINSSCRVASDVIFFAVVFY